jgi:hypothetical protein
MDLMDKFRYFEDMIGDKPKIVENLLSPLFLLAAGPGDEPGDYT